MVAVPLSLGVPVVGAVTRLALPPGQLRVTEEIVSAFITAVPGVSVITMTDGLTNRRVEVAGLGVAVAAGPGVRAHTLPARHLGRTKLRGPVVSNLAFLTEVSHGVVLAVVTDPGVRVTSVRVSVTLALPAVREVPEAGLALAAHPAECWLLGVTGTLPGVLVTELVLRAEVVTVARLTPGATEPKGCRGAAVTLPAHHEGLTVTAPVVFVTEDGGAASVVTPARPLPGALNNNSQHWAVAL